MNDEDDEEQFFQTVKANFVKTLQPAHKERTKRIIEGAVQKVHEMTIHAQMLLKLFFLWKYENNEELPFLDITYLRLVFKSVCLLPAVGGGAPMTAQNLENFNELRAFHHVHYLQTRVGGDLQHYDNLSAIIEYSALEYKTCIENNIKLHFPKYVRRYISAVYPNVAKRVASAILADVMTPLVDFRSPAEYHEFVEQCFGEIVPQANAIRMGSVYYDVKVYLSSLSSLSCLSRLSRLSRLSLSRLCRLYLSRLSLSLLLTHTRTHTHTHTQARPQFYIVFMIKMNKVIESRGLHILNIFPMRTSNIPGQITIDSTTLRRLLCQEGKMEKLTEEVKKEIWNKFFKTKTQQFKRFYFLVKTDAVSISIIKSKSIEGSRKRKRKKKNPKAKATTPYADDWIAGEKEKGRADFQDLTLLAFDPGVSQLLYGTNGSKSDAKRISYTNPQRVKETKSKKYQKIRKEKERSFLAQGLSIESWNALLRHQPKNTVGLNKLQKLYKQP